MESLPSDGADHFLPVSHSALASVRDRGSIHTGMRPEKEYCNGAISHETNLTDQECLNSSEGEDMESLDQPLDSVIDILKQQESLLQDVDSHSFAEANPITISTT